MSFGEIFTTKFCETKLKHDTGAGNISVLLLSLRCAVKLRCSFIIIWECILANCRCNLTIGLESIKCAGNWLFPCFSVICHKNSYHIYSLFWSPQTQSICLQASRFKSVVLSCRVYDFSSLFLFSFSFLLLSNCMYVSLHCSCSTTTPHISPKKVLLDSHLKIQNCLKLIVSIDIYLTKTNKLGCLWKENAKVAHLHQL